MGFSGIGIWQLLIVLLIVILIFGAKRLRNVGSDLGEAIKGFKKSVKDEDGKEAKKAGEILDGEYQKTSETDTRKQS